MKLPEPIILASQSPRRKELLSYMGIPFDAVTADVDEACQGAPDEQVGILAKRKAEKVCCMHPGRVIIAADTLVYGKNGVLGKPKDEEDAANMLHSLSGCWHEVFSGVCIIDARKTPNHIQVEVDRTKVLFTELTDKLIRDYIATGEPNDKAGAYAVQGRGGMFVESLTGSYSNVIGLPMALVRRMLESIGIQVL